MNFSWKCSSVERNHPSILLYFCQCSQSLPFARTHVIWGCLNVSDTLIMPLGYWLVTGHLTRKQNGGAHWELLFSYILPENMLSSCSLAFSNPSECVFRMFPTALRPLCLQLPFLPSSPQCNLPPPPPLPICLPPSVFFCAPPPHPLPP